MEWGNRIDFLRTLSKQTGKEPEALRNRPSLTKWTNDYWDAWLTLKSSRAVHQGGISPIPFTEIAAYLDMICVWDADDRERWVKMISALDSVYVQHINERLRAEREAQAKRSGRR